MLYESLLVMTAPFLVQVYSTGGPPLVLPYRVKFGGVAINDDDSSFTVIAPRPVRKYLGQHMDNHYDTIVIVIILYNHLVHQYSN